MELTNLSSNWKKLQQKLQTDKPKAAKPAALKRKSPNERPPPANGVKRKKLNASAAPAKKRKMDSLLSSETSQPRAASTATSASLALFAADNDIPAADLAAAYDLPTTMTSIPASTAYTDAPNAGLSANVAPGKYVAIDCEMVGVGPTPDQDSQLARASVVDFHGQQLYDSFVAPQLPVTDYRTAVSGITPALLANARSFAQVQKDVAALLDGRIVVGHAIKNDFGALMLSHPKRDIRDTSRHPAFRKLSAGKAPALRKLAKEVLGVEIQGGQHSSVEDARATMLLFRREKDAFEAEHAKKWGRPKADVGGGGDAAPKSKKKKKKGKK